MSQELFRLLLERLESPDDDGLTFDDIDGWPAGTFDALVATGILRKSSFARFAPCDECYDRHPVRFVHDTEGVKHPYVECPDTPEAGLIPVEPRRLERWTPNIIVLCRAVADGLQCGDTVKPVILGRLWHLGLSHIVNPPNNVFLARDVYMTRGASWPDAVLTFANLPAGSVSFTLTTCPHDALPTSIVAIPLYAVLDVNDTGVYVDASLTGALVAGRRRVDTRSLIPDTGKSDAPFDFDEESGSAWLHGRQFVLNNTRAMVVRYLWEQHKIGRPFVPVKYILNTILKDLGYVRIKDVFAGLKDWTLLVVKSDPKKDEPPRSYRLGV